MAGMAVIQIIGNIGRDPETRFTPTQRQVVSFTVAVNRVVPQGGDGKQEVTDWYRVTCWGNLAEFAANYLQKGRRVYVSGRFAPRTFTGQDGQPRLSLDITADYLIPLDSPQRADLGEGVPVASTSRGRSPAGELDTDLSEEDLPF
jgi:single-strand DNA-binding protein